MNTIDENDYSIIPPDGHTHPYQVHRDASGPEEFAQAAFDKGLPGISFTEHAPLWIPTGYHFLTEEELERYLGDAMATKAHWAGRLDIRVGVEADWHPRNADWLVALLERHPQIEFAAGSVHIHGIQWADETAGLDDEALTELALRETLTAVRSGLFVRLNHIDFFRFRHPGFDYHPERHEDAFREIFEEMARRGVVLTKLDGDARGGPALAVRAAAGVPIKLAGCGEKTEDLELFDARRMAQRIIGMGDMEGLLEKVQSATSEADIERMTKSLKSNRFTLEDMLMQLRQVQKLGPLEKVIEMLPIPGASKALKDADIDPKRLKRTEAIILSMTPKERRNPEIIKGGRRRRIAEGSGTTVQMVNQVLAQYEQMKNMMKTIGKMGGGKGPIRMPQRMGGMNGFMKGRRFFG